MFASVVLFAVLVETLTLSISDQVINNMFIFVYVCSVFINIIDFSGYTQLTRLSSGRANIVDQTQIN